MARNSLSGVATTVRPRRDRPPAHRPRIGSSVGALTPHLLSPGDPPPYRVLNPSGSARILLTCDHASWAIPRSLAGLGLEDEELQRHIGWDPGAAQLTLRLSELLDAPAVLSGYSRLVIDCNRTPGTSDSILPASDGTTVPGNATLGRDDARRRELELFRPYHQAIGRMLDRLRRESGTGPAFVAVHTFTPCLNGFRRPWHLGVLWDRDTPLARPLISEFRRVPDLIVGDNEPYSGTDQIGYSRAQHASRAGLPYVLLEVRSDLLSTSSEVSSYASMIATALDSALATLGEPWRTS